MTGAAAFRWQTAIAHSAVILWQVYSAITAFRSGELLANMLRGLGAQVGLGTTLFLMTHRWWLVVPSIFALLSVISMRWLESRPAFAVGVLAVGAVAALAMNIWWREAWFGPMFSLIKQVG